MGQSNFYLSYSEEPIKGNVRCSRCGDSAEIVVALLGEKPQRQGSFCLPCGQAVLLDLQHHYAIFGQTASISHAAYVHAPHHEDSEHGIIHWDGQGWSSDGPFAGA